MSEYLDKLQKKYARKSQSYWAKMRSTINLMEKSQEVSDETIERLHYELQDILDSGILNYPQTLEQAGLDADMSYRDKKTHLGLNREHSRNDKESRFLRDMEYKAEQGRKSNWSWRIAQESEDMHESGWHPFFVTLTVDPKRHNPRELWKEGREFRKYIRRLVNVVCSEMKHPPAHKKVVKNKQVIWDYRPESDYVRYAGVIEHGKSRIHDHGHFIIWLRRIPISWAVCPNKGIRDPSRRINTECIPMRVYWPASSPSLSPAMYFRSIGDIWETKYNFMLPVDQKTGEPRKISTPRVAGHYITKYLSKEHKEWHHRMKATRNLGMTKIKEQMSIAEKETVTALTWRAANSRLNLSLMRTHTIPQGLLRSEAKQTEFYNKFKHRQQDLKNLLQSNIGVFNAMLTSVRNGARPDRMDSQAFYDWVGEHLPVPQGYSDKKLILAHVKIGKYFRHQKYKPQHKKQGANDGHS